MRFYRTRESESSHSLLNWVLTSLNRYKKSFSRPISDNHDLVLQGGAMGSLFSFCQALAAPMIGRFSDRFGRKIALMVSLTGNILSLVIWVVAVDFDLFIWSRIVAGLSEGNVQIAIAIATDVSDQTSRGSTMAIVGSCFGIAFTVGPALGAALAHSKLVSQDDQSQVGNPFALTAGFALVLILIEVVLVFFALPETLPQKRSITHFSCPKPQLKQQKHHRHQTNSSFNTRVTLNIVHFFFLLLFSGLEFSLPFVTFDLFRFTPSKNGSVLAFIGLLSSLVQGVVTRKLNSLVAVRIGILTCAAAFAGLSLLKSVSGLYMIAGLLSITSATVVTGLNGLVSLEIEQANTGSGLGVYRSFGQFGRALGPLLFCSIYWWAGRQIAYSTGAAGMLGILTVVTSLVRSK